MALKAEAADGDWSGETTSRGWSVLFEKSASLYPSCSRFAHALFALPGWIVKRCSRVGGFLDRYATTIGGNTQTLTFEGCGFSDQVVEDEV